MHKETLQYPPSLALSYPYTLIKYARVRVLTFAPCNHRGKRSTISSHQEATTRRLLHHTALTSLFATFGLVIYRNKLPSPSIVTPCDYRMLQRQAKRQACLSFWRPCNSLTICTSILADEHPHIGRVEAHKPQVSI